MTSFFLSISTKYISVCQLLTPWQWSLALLICTSLLISAYTLASGWGGASQRWQIMIVRLPAKLLSIVCGLALLIGLGWTISAISISWVIYDVEARVLSAWLNSAKYYGPQIALGVGGGLTIGGIVWFLGRFRLQPYISRKLGIGVVESDSLTDARTVSMHIPQPFVLPQSELENQPC